jgi:hypothetical protein
MVLEGDRAGEMVFTVTLVRSADGSILVSLNEGLLARSSAGADDLLRAGTSSRDRSAALVAENGEALPWLCLGVVAAGSRPRRWPMVIN